MRISSSGLIAIRGSVGATVVISGSTVFRAGPMITLWVLLQLSRVHLVSAASCACSAVSIPVHVDVLVPKDPTDAFAGLKSNASSLRRVDDTYDVFGVFCQPAASLKNTEVVQLLVHGFTYTKDYWSPPVEEFRNYSYAAFSCDRGLPSLAIDSLGVGLSSRPANASDVQFPTSAGAITQLAHQLKSAPSILPGAQPFKKVIGIGHSAGSALLNFDAIVQGSQSPFDGLVLTSDLIVQPGAGPPLSSFVSARDDNPLRWASLDPAYITTDDRSQFYPPNPTSFSPRMVVFDNFTKDVGSESVLLQLPINSLPATGFTGPVAKIVGAEDQFFCVGTGRCNNVTELTAIERVLWPSARSFDVVVAQRSGHDMNLDFFADGPFDTFVGFVE